MCAAPAARRRTNGPVASSGPVAIFLFNQNLVINYLSLSFRSRTHYASLRAPTSLRVLPRSACWLAALASTLRSPARSASGALRSLRSPARGIQKFETYLKIFFSFLYFLSFLNSLSSLHSLSFLYFLSYFYIKIIFHLYPFYPF